MGALSRGGRTYSPRLSGDPPSPLVLATGADRSLVERPLLLPHLELRRVAPESVLLASEISSRVLHGKLHPAMLPLLDGVRSRQEIGRILSDRFSAVAVQSALALLASKGLIVSGEFSMPRTEAAFWTSLGASPRWVEGRLAASPVEVRGDDGLLVPFLERLGVPVVAGGNPRAAALRVFVTDSYLDEEHSRTNERLLADGVPWTLIRPVGTVPLSGPVFAPGVDRPCWACLSHRLRGNLEVENFLRHVGGDDGGVRVNPSLGPLSGAMLALAAVEIAKWIVLGDLAPIDSHVISFDAMFGGVERHHVMRRPQCRVCGDERLFRPDRSPSPVVLRPSPKPVRNSGGLRSVTPEETVRRYRHLVSPISGAVTEMSRITDECDRFLHVYYAGSNLALKNDSLMLLRNSLRTKSSGKGSSPKQAEASALCEALERYSGVFHGDEIRHRARFRDFRDGEAIHPNEVQRYSDMQYEHAAEFNARGSRFNYVPTRFDPDAEMDWSPVWSITRQCHRYLPTSMLYYAAPLEGGVLYCGPDSNGCAAGNTLEEAVLQGFFELVERDAFACWWYNRVSLPELDLLSFDDPYLAEAKAYYASISRDVWVLDATHDLGIPVFVAVSRRIDKPAEDILFSAGAHLDPQIAALRALCELNQYLGATPNVGTDGEGYRYDDPELLRWCQTARLEEHTYLAPDRSAPRRVKSRYPVPNTGDLLEDVEYCRSSVERLGMEFIVLDQTRPDLELPVAKTIVPGLRHFWARFGPGRLYDVPVAMGWLDRPTSESDLNPIPVFI